MASSCIFEQYEQLYLIRLAIVFLTSGAIHLNCFTGYGERKKNKPETDVSGCKLKISALLSGTECDTAFCQIVWC